MVEKTILVVILSLIMPGISGPNMKRINELSRKEGWAFLAYGSLNNESFLIHSGRIDSIYPKTNAVKDLGLDHYANPSLSSDGNYVAYIRRRSKSDHDEAIAIYSIQEKTSQDLITSTKDIYALYWSPAGNEIAFIAKDGYENNYRSRLYTVDINNHHVSELNPGQGTASMSWSPNGKEFVLASAEGIFVLNRESKSRRKIGNGAYPSWSPDGELIAYLDTNLENCYTITPDGMKMQKLFSYKQSKFAQLYSWYTLAGPLLWSPDMRYLIYHRESGGYGEQRKIYLLDLKTKKKEEIFSGEMLEIMGWRAAGR